MDFADEPFRIKILILGASNSGKTNILLKHFKNTFSVDQAPTSGSFYVTRDMKYKKTTLKIEVLEIGGSSLESAPQQAFHGVSGVIFVYDSTEKESFDALPSWIHKADDHCEIKDLVSIIVANKSDLEAKVDEEKAAEFANSINMVSNSTH